MIRFSRGRGSRRNAAAQKQIRGPNARIAGMAKVAKNTVALTSAQFSRILLSFVQLKILSVGLRPHDLGAYFTLNALAAILSCACQLGFPSVLTRFAAKYDVHAQKRALVKLTALVAGISILAGVLLMAVFVPLAGPVTRGLYHGEIGAELFLLAMGVLVLTAIRGTIYALFDGLRRMEVGMLLETVFLAVVNALLYGYRHAFTLELVFWIRLWVSAGFLALTLALAAAALARLPYGGGRQEAVLPDIRTFWLGAIFGSLVAVALSYGDQFLISLFLSIEVVSVFAVATRVFQFYKVFLAVVPMALGPEITRQWERGRRDEVLSEILGVFTRGQWALSLFVAATSIGMSGLIIRVVSTAEYGRSAVVLSLLCASLPVISLYDSITTTMKSINRIRYSVLSDALWVASYLVALVVLLQTGNVLAATACYFLASVLTLSYNVRVARAKTQLAWRPGRLLRFLAFTPLILLASWAGGRWTPGPALVGLVAGGVLATVAFNFCVVASGLFDAREVERMTELLERRSWRRAFRAAWGWPAKLIRLRAA